MRKVELCRAAWGAVWIVAALASPGAAAERVVTLGDSWAYLVAPSVQTMLNVFHAGTTVANESFGGGTAAQHAAALGDITNKLNAHPNADIVWLSSGGNDMLLGQAGGGWFKGMDGGAQTALFDTIGSNVNTVVNHILNHRPDIQVMIAGYDYTNWWDTVPNKLNPFDPPTVLWLNLGAPFPIDINSAFIDMETRKQTIAAGSRRVHYVNMFGLSHLEVGYNDSWPLPPLPPGTTDPNYPTDTSRLAGGNDPIHLNTQGYNMLALHSEVNFFTTSLDDAVMSLNVPSLNFGKVLVGASATLGVSASNFGASFTKVTGGVFPAVAGEFAGAGGSFGPLFKDPTLGSDTAGTSYSYTPSARGEDNLNLTVTSVVGGNRPLPLIGKGVAPDNNVTHADAGLTRVGSTKLASLTVTNLGDGNQSGAGAVSNLHGSIGGASGVFTGTGAAVNLPDGANLIADYTYAPTERGVDSAGVLASFTNGHSSGTNQPQDINVQLDGQGVGPLFDSSVMPGATIDFGTVLFGSPVPFPLDIFNITSDPNGGNSALTDLTLTSAAFGGPDAAEFFLPAFAPGTVIAKGGMAAVSVDLTFAGPNMFGLQQATLTIFTDENAALGGSGSSFSFNLLADVVSILVDGDVDLDGDVDFDDFLLLQVGYGISSGARRTDGDLDDDDDVDFQDFLILQVNFGADSDLATAGDAVVAVPEPSSWTLMLACGAMFFWRRRVGRRVRQAQR